jgi:membrane-associated phospholipid phosphatase
MKSAVKRAFLLVSIFTLFLSPCAHAKDEVESAGDVMTAIVALAAGGLTIGFRDTEGFVQLVKATALNLSATMALKYTVDERGPDGDSNSFPSAHSSVSFSAAEFIRRRYGWEYGVPAYGISSFVAYSRVDSKKHYVHDVLAGAAIGMASSYLFTSPRNDTSIQAEAAPGYFGVRLTKVW